jgi:transposase
MFSGVAGSRPDIVKPRAEGIRTKSPSWRVIGSCPSTARRQDPSRIISSYCRCVESKRISNGKKKGEGNAKNGNRYLAWAFIEAAAAALRCCPQARQFYEPKKAKRLAVVAMKALAHKLARAAYYMMRDGRPF